MIYNPYPSVELPFGKDNKYFLDLFDSILQVDRNYIDYRVVYNESFNGYEKHLERVFAYELYRHWGNKVHRKNSSLVLNAEIQKVIEVNSIICDIQTNSENQKTEKTTLYPDMVLHHSQGDDKDQRLICEIKRDKNLSGSLIFGDIYKICCYMTKDMFKGGKSPFRYGVFIVIGDMNFSSIFGKLTNQTKINVNDGNETIFFSDFIKDDKMSSSFERIVCISYDGNTLEYKTFNDIVKSQI